LTRNIKNDIENIEGNYLDKKLHLIAELNDDSQLEIEILTEENYEKLWNVYVIVLGMLFYSNYRWHITYGL
jgi:ribonucleotide reductase beta subunit family protein with ferritin-like domain